MYKIISTEKTWLESEAVQQLKNISQLEGMVIAFGYPDLHPGRTPVGASFITEDIIYPHLIGNDIGCSISLYETSIFQRKFNIEKSLKLLSKLKLKDIKNEFNFGTIGGGNHFGEFTKVAEIIDEAEFMETGIDKARVQLLIHSGSRGFGESILQKYITEYDCEKGLVKDTEGFINYFKDYEKAVTFARKNRNIIAERLCEALTANCSRLIIEAVHNGVEKKDRYIIHRKGAAPAEDNKYVVIAGSRGTSSYIVKPLNPCFDTGYSLAHGAGRKWSRSGCKEKLQGKFKRKDIKNGNFGYNVICSDKNLLYEEAPEAYKNIHKVVEDLEAFNMIKIVAKLEPLITYKD